MNENGRRAAGGAHYTASRPLSAFCCLHCCMVVPLQRREKKGGGNASWRRRVICARSGGTVSWQGATPGGEVMRRDVFGFFLLRYKNWEVGVIKTKADVCRLFMIYKYTSWSKNTLRISDWFSGYRVTVICDTVFNVFLGVLDGLIRISMDSKYWQLSLFCLFSNYWRSDYVCIKYIKLMDMRTMKFQEEWMSSILSGWAELDSWARTSSLI